ncbi:MAG: DUF2933 domain-containing protein [Mycobacterium sp.]|jgi:hypothetical protein|nr:DUF2933 domain-containing protein [Mycobacterium sp.]MCB0924251.1 DUF2933 domain-containing protein [Mycobacterium sp.]MCB0938223.1 DUF2933 domain-containing protein [Mycobacterium sp.]MCW1958257.1 DUF2933 domain-containing protein [Mycobacterium sp.]
MAKYLPIYGIVAAVAVIGAVLFGATASTVIIAVLLLACPAMMFMMMGMGGHGHGSGNTGPAQHGVDEPRAAGSDSVTSDGHRPHDRPVEL